MSFELTPEVRVDRDEKGRVVQLRHIHKKYTAAMAGLARPTPVQLAEQYVRDVAAEYGQSEEETSALSEAVSGEVAEESTKLRRAQEKQVLETSVVSFQQTCCGLPVWNSSLSVVVAGDPPEVVSSSSMLHTDVQITDRPTVPELQSFAGARPGSLSEMLGIEDSAGEGFQVHSTRLLVYRYEPDERFDLEVGPLAAGAGSAEETGGAGYDPAAGIDLSEYVSEGGAGPTGPEGVDDAGPVGPPPAGGPTSMLEDSEGAGYDPANPESSPGAAYGGTSESISPDTSFQQSPPILPLQPVPAEIVPGKHYVVREVLFTLSMPGWKDLNWRAFVEPKSGAVLYLRALTASATCSVFETDPISKSGNPLTGASPAAQLDLNRTSGLTLQNLDSPVAGVQHLRGRFADVQNTDSPAVAPPTETSPFSFEYSAVDDDFSAANAYYHTDWMYRLVEGMGIPINTYFDGTTFPVPVDHRGESGGVNAHANGNTTGDGMGRFRYGLVQSGQPVGIATTARVCLHEFGHALLWDHVNSPNFGWAHSAGDTLAAILHDPGSKAPDRFLTFPFVTQSSGISRRHDRKLTDGFAWGGTRDDRRYGSEQILSTLMFRIYRVTGGDDVDINVKKFAARYLAYLIIRAIGTLTAMSTDPRTFVTALENADELTVNFEGHAGGAWHKLFRWSFEKQGLYQPPGAPTPVTSPGAPPPVDVYIDDGRNGEYEPYLPNFGNSPDVWNRLASDGGAANQNPAAGVTNYLYVRVSNRGTSTANNVTVKVYQGTPGSALRWPTDWSALTTAQLSAGSIGPGSSKVVGPFKWAPAQAGPLSVLVSASAVGDESNADTVNGAIPNSRLVPFDNNIAQKDFNAVAGAAKCVGMKIGSGSTEAGATDWKPYGNNTGVYLDISTKACNFRTTPRYFTSLAGRSSHWSTTGATSIYSPSPTGFRIYVRWSNGSSITPAQANALQWHINWFGVEEG